jgi:hypothetical protein
MIPFDSFGKLAPSLLLLGFSLPLHPGPVNLTNRLFYLIHSAEIVHRFTATGQCVIINGYVSGGERFAYRQRRESIVDSYISPSTA